MRHQSLVSLLLTLSLLFGVAASADSSRSVFVCVAGNIVGRGFLLNGSAYVPLRVVGESLGASVEYNRFLERVDVTPAASVARTRLTDAQCLSGLHGVHVIVEMFRADAEQDGLKADDVKAFVESRLINSKIPVLSEQQQYNAPGHPFLYINVNPVNNSQGAYAYSVNIELDEDVSLIRRPGVFVSAAVWERGAAGTVGSHNLADLKDNVGVFVDQFINDYLKANT